MAKGVQRDKGMKQFSLRIDEDTAIEINKLAAFHKTSFCEETRVLLEWAVEETLKEIDKK